jgi:hypothetical protein
VIIDRPNGDDKLNFKCEWIAWILSPKLQKMLIAGLGELQFPAECTEEAVGLLQRNAKNLIEFREWDNPQTLIRKQRLSWQKQKKKSDDQSAAAAADAPNERTRPARAGLPVYQQLEKIQSASQVLACFLVSLLASISANKQMSNPV